jgi:hypothetical protein
MALLPNASQIPAQRVEINERSRTGASAGRNADPPPPSIFVAREWYRFFDTVHTYLPTPTVFTPVFTPVTNVTALTAGASFANQMGTVVALTGTFTLDPTAAGNTVFCMTPPVLDGLTLSTAAGTFVTTASGASDIGSVVAVSGTLEFRLNAVNTASAVYAFNVNYQIA